MATNLFDHQFYAIKAVSKELKKAEKNIFVYFIKYLIKTLSKNIF